MAPKLRPYTFLLVLIPLALGGACSRDNPAAPRALAGVLDLSSRDLAHTDPVRLDGEWEFYWNQLLAPQDFLSPRAPAKTGYLQLPHSWTGVDVKGKELDSAGFATFRLNIHPGASRQDLALQIGLVNSAYRLWANDTLLIENGMIGRSKSEEKPIQSFQRAALPNDGRPINLLLQISNHHDREGGVVSSLVLGTTDRLAAADQKRLALNLLSIGSLFVIGVYHIFLYAFRTKNKAPLYFGVYCLLWMSFSLTNSANGWPVRLLSGDIPAWMVNRLDLICVVASVPVIYSFLRTLYPDEFSLRMQQAAWVVAGVFLVPGLSASTLTFTSIISFYYLFCIALICCILVMLVNVIRKRREGAPYILTGFTILGLVSINDMLYDLQVIHSMYLMEAGMLTFILFQSIALSLRYSRAFTSVELLSEQLAEKNQALEQEMAERARLEREIVNTSEEERRLISRELHDGLCQKLTGARLQFSAFARKLGDVAGTKEMISVSSLLEETVNQAYDLSRGLWPVEYDARGVSPSLEELTQRLAASSGITIEFSQKRGCEQCANTAVIQLYRIAQEAITNAVKHARPGKITVGLDCGARARITLTVQDNGVGRHAAVPTQGGLGLSIMFHRARIIGGELTIADASGGGTVVTCTAPCAGA